MFELSQRYYRPYIHVFLIKILFISEPKLNIIEPLNAMKRNLAVQGSPLPLCIVRCNEYTLCTQRNNISGVMHYQEL